jgi:hypothetical protein
VLDWNAPLVRVFVHGVEFIPQKGVERMIASHAPASYVKGRTVYVRDADGTPLQECEVKTPWVPSATLALGAAGCLGVLTGLLLWARNPFLMQWRTRLAALPLARALLVAVLIGALALRVAGFSFPSWENDSDDYFRPIFQWLSGLPVTPTDRPLGYPAFIALALGLFRDFRTLVVLQMAASVCSAAAMGGLVIAAARRLFPPGPLRFLTEGVAVAGAAYFVLNERVLQREWSLLPEALAALWLGGQLWLAWRLMAVPLSSRRMLGEFGCFCALGWLTFFTKSNWGFALALLLLPLVVGALLWANSRREFLLRIATGAAVLVGLSAVAVGVQQLTPLNTQASLEIRSRVLVCWHVDLVRPEIARRLAAQPPPGEEALLREFATLLDGELAETRIDGPGAYPTLGYDADRLYYYGFARAELYPHLSARDRAAFCRDLFFGALRRHPWLYMRKVARQWALYFAEPYGPARIQLPHVADALERSENFLAHPPAYLPADLREHYRPVITQARQTYDGLWPSPSRLALSLRVQEATEWLNPAFRWLGLPILLTIIAACWKPWRVAVPWRTLAPVLGLAVWVSGSAAACALTSSALQALEVQRYVDLFLPFTVVSECLWPFVALAILIRRKQ